MRKFQNLPKNALSKLRALKLWSFKSSTTKHQTASPFCRSWASAKLSSGVGASETSSSVSAGETASTAFPFQLRSWVSLVGFSV